jgi:hypothetical protein
MLQFLCFLNMRFGGKFTSIYIDFETKFFLISHLGLVHVLCDDHVLLIIGTLLEEQGYWNDPICMIYYEIVSSHIVSIITVLNKLCMNP